MKILVLTHIYPPSVDGGSRVISKLAEYFHQNKHDILIVTTDCNSTDDFVNPKSKTPKFQSSQPPEYPIFRLPVYKNLRRPLKLLRLILRSDLLQVFERGPVLKLLPLIKTIFQIIRFRPDLIITGPFPTTIPLYARFIRFVITLFTRHRPGLLTNPCFHPTDNSFQLTPLIKSLQKSDYLWTLTDFESEYFINNFHINPKKIINAGGGIDSDFLIHKFESINNKTNLLFVGSFAYHKNINTLIDAFALISPHFPTCRLVLAGQKTLYFSHLQQKIDSLPPQIVNRIDVKFSFKDSQYTTLLDSALVLVQPSLEESFGLTLIEAWARQIPVLVSDIQVFAELINKTKGGLVFKKDSPSHLADQIKKLLSNPDLSNRLALNGYHYTRNHYTWDKIGKSICQRVF